MNAKNVELIERFPDNECRQNNDKEGDDTHSDRPKNPDTEQNEKLKKTDKKTDQTALPVSLAEHRTKQIFSQDEERITLGKTGNPVPTVQNGTFHPARQPPYGKIEDIKKYSSEDVDKTKFESGRVHGKSLSFKIWRAASDVFRAAKRQTEGKTLRILPFRSKKLYHIFAVPAKKGTERFEKIKIKYQVV